MSNRILPPWVRPYIGIPYVPRGRSMQGVDCWGLFVLVMQREFHIEVPSFADDVAYTCRADALPASEFLKKHKDHLGWHPIPIKDAREGDGILFRVFGQPLHVGVVVTRNIVLHVEEGIASVIENYNESLWRNRIVEEHITGKVAYRHESRF